MARVPSQLYGGSDRLYVSIKFVIQPAMLCNFWIYVNLAC